MALDAALCRLGSRSRHAVYHIPVWILALSFLFLTSISDNSVPYTYSKAGCGLYGHTFLYPYLTRLPSLWCSVSNQ